MKPRMEGYCEEIINMYLAIFIPIVKFTHVN